jgi:hypothetical protein
MKLTKRLVFVIPLRFLGASGYMEVLCPVHRKNPGPGIEEPPTGEFCAETDSPTRAADGQKPPRS